MPSSAGALNPWWPWHPTDAGVTHAHQYAVKMKLHLLTNFAFIAPQCYLSFKYLPNAATA